MFYINIKCSYDEVVMTLTISENSYWNHIYSNNSGKCD